MRVSSVIRLILIVLSFFLCTCNLLQHPILLLLYCIVLYCIQVFYFTNEQTITHGYFTLLYFTLQQKTKSDGCDESPVLGCLLEIGIQRCGVVWCGGSWKDKIR